MLQQGEKSPDLKAISADSILSSRSSSESRMGLERSLKEVLADLLGRKEDMQLPPLVDVPLQPLGLGHNRNFTLVRAQDGPFDALA
jgi:hypothetical protein